MPLFQCPSCGSTVDTVQQYLDAECMNGHPVCDYEPVAEEYRALKVERQERIAAEKQGREQAG